MNVCRITAAFSLMVLVTSAGATEPQEQQEQDVFFHVRMRGAVAAELKRDPAWAVAILKRFRANGTVEFGIQDFAFETLYRNPEVAKPAEPWLREWIGRHESRSVRRMSAMVLATLGHRDKAVIDVLIDGLCHPHQYNGMGRVGAEQALVLIGKPAVPALDKRGAYHVLAAIGPDAVVALGGVIAGLSDDDEMQRVEAAYALYRITGEVQRPLPLLIAALDSRKSQVRTRAAKRLMLLGRDAAPARDALVKALDDTGEVTSEQTRFFAKRALALIDGEPAEDE